MPPRIAYFISSHGFGHAARSAAIITALLDQNPSIEIDIYSETPEWFFIESSAGYANYFKMQTDIGVTQRSPMEMDIPDTLNRVTMFLDSLPAASEQLARTLLERNYTGIIADISPLGIAAAKKAGIPCILFENFTWDWIYQPFTNGYPNFHGVIRQLKSIFEQADFHAQFIPACQPDATANLTIPPCSRKTKQTAAATRQKLGIKQNEKLGLISMGGIPDSFALNQIGELPNPAIRLAFVGSFTQFENRGSTICIPHQSDFYHPDLVEAADFVIGKAGYSTMAEIYNAAKPFGYLLRPDFRESTILGEFLSSLPYTTAVSQADFDCLNLSKPIEFLLSDVNFPRPALNGSKIAADFVIDCFKLERSFPRSASEFPN